MLRCGLIFTLFVFSYQSTMAVTEADHLLYEDVPLNVDLAIKQELRIHFGESIELGLPPSLASKLNAASVQGTLFLTASNAFKRQRIYVKRLNSGRFVLLDLATKSNARSSQDIYIAYRDRPTLKRPSELTPVALTRYAAQQLFAPKRLLERVAGVRQTTLPTDVSSIYLDSAVKTKPLGAWRTRSQIVVAIQLENTSSIPVKVNPKAVRGHWRTVSFLRTELAPANEPAQTTVMFLVGSASKVVGWHH